MEKKTSINSIIISGFMYYRIVNGVVNGMSYVMLDGIKRIFYKINGFFEVVNN